MHQFLRGESRSARPAVRAGLVAGATLLAAPLLLGPWGTRAFAADATTIVGAGLGFAGVSLAVWLWARDIEPAR